MFVKLVLVCFQLEKGRSHTCIRLAINQPEQKLVGVVAATVEAASLQRKSARSCHQLPRLTEAIFPPRSDWIANYRPTYVSISVDLTLALRVYRTTHGAHWQCGGRRSLWHWLRCFHPAPWLRMATKESRSSNFRWTTGRTDGQTDRQTDKCNFSIMILRTCQVSRREGGLAKLYLIIRERRAAESTKERGPG